MEAWSQHYQVDQLLGTLLHFEDRFQVGSQEEKLKVVGLVLSGFEITRQCSGWFWLPSRLILDFMFNPTRLMLITMKTLLGLEVNQIMEFLTLNWTGKHLWLPMTNCWQLKMVLIKIQLVVEKGLFQNGFKGVPGRNPLSRLGRSIKMNDSWT